MTSPVPMSEILDELDSAVVDHLRWMKDLHRRLLCGDPPPDGEIPYDPHHLCRFGAWYVRQQHAGLVDQPAVRTLYRLHRDMHDKALDLVEGLRSGTAPTPDDYDPVADSALAFLAQARRLERAFSRATQDLDPLTGVHNRQAMDDVLERERARHLRTGDPCCIALADLDRFKAVNDSHGHQAGDQVLVAAAECTLTHLRPFDYVFRYGGEEFLLFLPNTDLANGTAVVDRLRGTLAELDIPLESGEDLRITSSFGVAEMRGPQTVAAAIDQADRALYRAKQEGRNRVCAWSAGAEGDV